MFWYIATPYTKYRRGLWAAYRMACAQTAFLMSHGVPAFSPIAHTHGVSRWGCLGEQPHGYWIAIDVPMMRAAHGLIVVRADGWDQSAGVSQEIAEFLAAGKPVLFMDPGFMPLGDDCRTDARLLETVAGSLLPCGHPASPWVLPPPPRRVRRTSRQWLAAMVRWFP